MLDDVLGWGGTLPRNRVLLVKDTVAASASFLLLYLLKKILATPDSLVIFVGLKEPFSHYSRIARKQGCNLAMHQDHGSLVYIDLLSKTILEHSSLPTDAAVINEGNKLILLFQKFIRILKEQPGRNTWIIIDDISLIEVIAQGNNAHVRDFLHYCRTLATDQQICSLLLLTHLDAYENIDETMMANHLELLSDTVINVVPLVTGQAVDVHGQVIVEHKVPCNVNPTTCMDGFQNSRGYGLHYKLMENTVQFFTPGKHV